jgi:hypothetical protein
MQKHEINLDKSCIRKVARKEALLLDLKKVLSLIIKYLIFTRALLNIVSKGTDLLHNNGTILKNKFNR